MKEMNNFVFFPSFLECVNNAPESERADIVYCIVQYGIYGRVPKKTTQSFKMIFPAIKPIIDASVKRYNSQVENGKKGGRPKKDKNPNETQAKPKENPIKTQSEPNTNPNETQVKAKNKLSKTEQKPNQNLNKEKDKDKEKNKDIKEEYQHHQKEINKEKDFDVDDDVEMKKKQFAFDCCNQKLINLYSVLDTGMYDRIESLFLYIFEKDSFIISNEKVSSGDVLLKLVQIFAGNSKDVVNRFCEIFNSIDNAENVSNKLNYSVSTLYRYACKNC